MQLSRDAIFFHMIQCLWVFFFLRIVLINHRAIRFIKRNYPKEWEDKFHLFGTFAYGGNTIFDAFSEINDLKFKKFEQAYVAAIRQLFVTVLCSIMLILMYIYIFIGF